MGILTPVDIPQMLLLGVNYCRQEIQLKMLTQPSQVRAEVPLREQVQVVFGQRRPLLEAVTKQIQDTIAGKALSFPFYFFLFNDL